MCDDVKGSWQRPNDNLVLTLSQKGCNIEGQAPNAGFDHALSGKLEGGRFTIELVRHNKSSGCMTTMYGTLSKVNATQISVDFSGSDGKCDLKTDYTEHSVYSKR
jgi:hypothetical protein